MFEDPFFIKHWSYVLSNHPSKRVERPPGVMKRVFCNYFNPLDQFIATPLANINVLENTFGHNFFAAINNSRYAAVWHGALLGVSLLTLLIGHIVFVYRKLRENEKESHFFYFRRLLQIDPSLKIKEKIMGEEGIDFEILIAAAYFYSPDISQLVCWKRRFFCWGKRRKEYAYLMDYLTKEGQKHKKTKKEILNGIFIQTIDELVKYLNEKTGTSDLPEKYQRKDGTYLIIFSKEYSKMFFSGGIHLPQKTEKDEDVSLSQSIFEVIEEASFFYWLCMFVSYFAPTVGLVAGLSFPPLAAAFSFLIIRGVYVIYAFKKDSINKQIGSLNNTEIDYLKKIALKEKYESDDVKLKKQEVFSKEQAADRVGLKPFQDSKLHKDLMNVIGNRRFLKVSAIVEAFIGGCFLPFFGIWLFTDLFRLVVGLAIGGAITGPTAPAIFTVVFMVIAGVTLLLGVGYGIKKAIVAGKKQDKEYQELMNEVGKLGKYPVNKTKVLNLSLHDYDRFFRRYNLKQPAWTRVKKLLSRSWVVINRLGTGSLVFRLVIWGSITSFVAVPVVWIAPISVPFIAIFSLAFAVWYCHFYNVKKTWGKARKVVNHFYLSRMVAVKEMIYKEALLGKEELCTDLLLAPSSLSTSKSEVCLNAQNMDNIDLIKLHLNDSGNTSPESEKAKISFKNSRKEARGRAFDSKSLNLNDFSRGLPGGFDSQKGKNDLSSVQNLNSQVVVCHRC